MAREIRVAFDNGLLRSAAAVAWLLGLPTTSPPTLLAPLFCQHFSKPLVPDFDTEARELRVLVPAGLEIVGCVRAGGSDQDAVLAKAAELALSMRAALGAPKGNPRSVIAGCVLVNEDVVYKLYSSVPTPFMEPLEVVTPAGSWIQDFWKSYRLLRCQLQLDLTLYLPEACSFAEFSAQVARAVGELLADLKGPSTVFIAENLQGQQKRSVLIEPKKFDAHEGVASGKVDVLISDLDSSQLVVITSGVMTPVPVSLTAFRKQSSSNEKVEAPLLEYLPVTGSLTPKLLSLNLDVLAVERADAPLSRAVTTLVLPALCDQLTAMQNVITKNRNLDSKVGSYHFLPTGFLNPVTVIYDLSYGETETMQVEERKKLHRRLGLPLNRPLLRVANALNFAFPSTGRPGGAKRLVDVQTTLTGGPVTGGQISLVQGSYEYYHYMQDHVDDSGWGCAYRSLQTIVSWFKLQHYTSLDVLSHMEIQKTLVDVGDKEPSFVGSREWIGAIELSFVLDKYLGVSCKILNVNSGADLPGKCRELALHFQTQGTPVMIGGGVLAYTLLGVQYNEFTGESAFLILDPHYTGGEDLKSIIGGGWCGWKKAVSDRGEEFFLRNKFYNLLLPQRPSTV